MQNKEKTVIEELVELLTEQIDSIGNEKEKIRVLNETRKALHEISPFKSEPVDLVEWIKNDSVSKNDYNPNEVAPPMQLLEISILADGYSQPIVTWPIGEDKREVIDGFHRSRVGRESKEVNSRVKGYLPIVTIRKSQEGKGDRIASTIRHNRARGRHQVSAMSDIVIELKKRNWSEQRIAKELGMDQDEILRLCQISGIAEAFENDDFSKAWEAAMQVHDEVIDDLEFEQKGE